jgi:hypothetical protein
MKITYRIWAAYRAFIDPKLVEEAQSIRSTLQSLDKHRGTVAILRPLCFRNSLHPVISFIPHKESQYIKDFLNLS